MILAILGYGAMYLMLAIGGGAAIGNEVGKALGKNPRVFAGIGAGLGLLTLGLIWALQPDPEPPVHHPRPTATTTVDASDADWDDFDRDDVDRFNTDDGWLADEAFEADEVSVGGAELAENDTLDGAEGLDAHEPFGVDPFEDDLDDGWRARGNERRRGLAGGF